MSEYYPDVWVIVKITNGDESHNRVFAGWYGGYCGSDSWKMNSGITAIREAGDMIEFDGASGSTYFCHKNTEKMSMYMVDVLASMKRQMETNNAGQSIEVVDYKDN